MFFSRHTTAPKRRCTSGMLWATTCASKFGTSGSKGNFGLCHAQRLVILRDRSNMDVALKGMAASCTRPSRAVTPRSRAAVCAVGAKGLTARSEAAERLCHDRLNHAWAVSVLLSTGCLPMGLRCLGPGAQTSRDPFINTYPETATFPLSGGRAHYRI